MKLNKIKEIKIIEKFKFKDKFQITTSVPKGEEVPEYVYEMAHKMEVHRRKWKAVKGEVKMELIIHYEELR